MDLFGDITHISLEGFLSVDQGYVLENLIMLPVSLWALEHNK